MNMINKTFNNLPQRAIYYFIATFPSFTYVNLSSATVDEQKNAYCFIKSIYEQLFDDPAIMGFKIIPDDYFNDWEQQKEKPKLTSKIRGIIAKIEDLIEVVFHICLIGKSFNDSITIDEADVQLKQSMCKQIEKFGIKFIKTDCHYTFTFPSNTLNGLTSLAQISSKNVKPPKDNKQKPYLLFSRGVFDVGANFTQEVFGNMLVDRSAFDKLILFLEENNYLRIDNKEYNNQISLDYIKNYGNINDELKGAWAERTHGGIEVVYDEIRKNQPVFSLRIPYFNDLLMQSDKMNIQVKNFILNTSKKCDNCRYCVQTDKTGKRLLICVDIDGIKMCPLFCGFQYRWKTIDNELAENMIEMLMFIDEIFKEKLCIE